jgi:hypothetical protein
VYIYKFAVLFYCAERHKKTAAFIYLSTAEIAPPVADLFYFQQKASYSSGGGKIIRPCKKERELRYFCL